MRPSDDDSKPPTLGGCVFALVFSLVSLALLFLAAGWVLRALAGILG